MVSVVFERCYRNTSSNLKKYFRKEQICYNYYYLIFFCNRLSAFKLAVDSSTILVTALLISRSKMLTISLELSPPREVLKVTIFYFLKNLFSIFDKYDSYACSIYVFL